MRTPCAEDGTRRLGSKPTDYVAQDTGLGRQSMTQSKLQRLEIPLGRPCSYALGRLHTGCVLQVLNLPYCILLTLKVNLTIVLSRPPLPSPIPMNFPWKQETHTNHSPGDGWGVSSTRLETATLWGWGWGHWFPYSAK